MTAIRISNFGGERPSISPRALPNDGAQVNRNLLLTTSEFRPLAQDAVRTTQESPAGARSIHRFRRDAAGALISDATAGWLFSPEQRSYVRGQVNDDLLDRAYFSTEDGSQPLRAVSAKEPSVLRQLGVPQPNAPALSVQVNDEVTAEEAREFIYGACVEAIAKAMNDSMREPSATSVDFSRRTQEVVNGSWTGAYVPAAGPFQTYGFKFIDEPGVPDRYLQTPTYLVAMFSAAGAGTMKLDVPAMDGLIIGSTCAIPILALAFRYWSAEYQLRDALKMVKFPAGFAGKTGQRVLSQAQEDVLVQKLSDWFNPDLYAADLRAKLDVQVKEFAYFLVGAAADSGAEALARQKAIGELCHEINLRGAARRTAFADTVALMKQWIEGLGGVNAFVDTTERYVDARFYATTFVTDWEEESQMSAPSAMVEVDQNDVVTVARPSAVSGEALSSRFVTRWRIYRTNTGSQSAAFQFVKELPLATATFADTLKGAELGEPCPTLTWAEPPKRPSGANPYLRGLVGMPNGIMAGFLDNFVAFCDPYHPYAWPVEYQITTEHPIVGLAVFGQTLFVGTTANPYFISGADSASMSAQKMDVDQACASTMGIAPVEGGVLYVSPDGLCVADPSGIKVVSLGVFSRADWQALNPRTMRLFAHERVVFIQHDTGTLVFDAGAGKLGRLELDRVDAVYHDREADATVYASGGTLRELFGAGDRRVGKWRSPLVTAPKPTSMAWLRAFGDQDPLRPLTVRLFGDGVLRHTAVLTGIDPVRLPAGRYLESEIEIEGAARITAVELASSTAELQAV